MLKVLEEMRIPIHCVTGTSMGSIVGGTFAAGVTPEKLQEVVLKTDWDEIFRDQPPREEIAIRRKVDDYKTLFRPEFGVKDGGLALPTGVIAGVSIEAFFRVLTAQAYDISDFRKLPIPFRAMATDIETGESVVLDHGSIAQAMRASMSVPGALAPVEIDGKLLVDGGIANNLPIDEARKLCADVIIAVNISTPPLKRSEITSALSVAGQLVNFLGKQTVDEQLKSLTSRDVLIAPDLGDISAAKFDRSADAIRIGEEATRKLADSLQRYSIPPDQYAALRKTQIAGAKPPPTVGSVEFKGLERTNPEVLRALVETKPGEPLNEAKIGDDLRRIYGRDDFEGIGYTIGGGTTGPRALIIEPREKSWGPDYLRFGLGLESDFKGDNAVQRPVRIPQDVAQPAGRRMADPVPDRAEHLPRDGVLSAGRGVRTLVRPAVRAGRTADARRLCRRRQGRGLPHRDPAGGDRRRGGARHLGPAQDGAGVDARQCAGGHGLAGAAVGEGADRRAPRAAVRRSAGPGVVPDRRRLRERPGATPR